MRKNFTGPLKQSLLQAGFTASMSWWTGKTYTHLRKDGTRRVKLWLGSEVFYAPQKKQKKLERALKANYGDAYLGGYFIAGPWVANHRSFCIVLDNSRLGA